jgi:hypothetical protein
MGCIRHTRIMMAMITGLFYTDRGAAPCIFAGPYHFSKMIEIHRLPIMALSFYICYPEHHYIRVGSVADGGTSEDLQSRVSYARHHGGSTSISTTFVSS